MVKNRLKVDIFCQIVDNFGDIGVTWRLAKQLSAHYDYHVRLWVDDIVTASKLIPALADFQHQADRLKSDPLRVDGVDIHYWQANQDTHSQPAEIVIEAFACELPQPYQLKMPGNTRCWLNLEYLSAEAWVPQFHLQSSIQSLNGLRKTFFFPGFSLQTGGLIRENDLMNDIESYRQITSQSGHLNADSINISLFTYPHAPVYPLLNALANMPQHICCHIPLTAIQPALEQFFSCSIQSKQQYQQGNLTVVTSDFLTQTEYDQRLWQCDLNFVRGEDSLVRAIWAGKPFIWLPYQQSDEAHLDKLSAFLDVYWGEDAKALASLNWEWANGIVDIGKLAQFFSQMDRWIQISQSRSQLQAQQQDLAFRLDQFIQSTI